MRRLAIDLLLLGGLFCLLAAEARSQGPAAALTFRNDTKAPIIIQGTSTVGGMVRRGQPVLVAPGRVGGDFNVPAGPRFYSVYDANQPSHILAKDVPIVVPAGTNILVSVRAHANGQVALVPEAARP